MSDEIKELTIKAELIKSDKVVGRLEKKFTLLESEEIEDEVEPKTLDEIITEFLQEIEKEAKEKKLEIRDKDKFHVDSVMQLLLFFIKPDGNSATLKVPVQPLTEEGEGEMEKEENGEPIDN